MNRSEQSHTADGQIEGIRFHRRVFVRWRKLDTDWQSVLVALVLLVSIVGLDVPVPA